jgi:hypothetical protein
VFLSDSSQNTARNKLFEELFRGITLDDVFDDVTSAKTRNKVQVIKSADTLVEYWQEEKPHGKYKLQMTAMVKG